MSHYQTGKIGAGLFYLFRTPGRGVDRFMTAHNLSVMPTTDPTNGRLKALELWLSRRRAKNAEIRKRCAEAMRISQELHVLKQRFAK